MVPAPRRLRAVLQFARLPARALAVTRQVVDDDHAFRVRVRDAVSEGEVGRPGWLFLARPEGWERELGALASAAEEARTAADEARAETGMARRLVVLEEALGRSTSELGAAHAELMHARDRLAEERRARRSVESDAGRLRRRVEALETRVRERDAELASGRDMPGRAHLDTGPAGPEDRAPWPESGGAAVAPAPAPPTPPVDRAGVAAALDAAARALAAVEDALAAAGRALEGAVGEAEESRRREAVRREPTTPPPSVAAPERRPVRLPPAVRDDTVEAAEHLVRVRGVLVLVDGYNVTKLARPGAALSEQRRWLVDAATELAARSGAEVVVVFDGADESGSAPADLPRRAGVQVRFSAAAVEADDLLLELVGATSRGRPVVVASDDRRIRDGASRMGANVIGSGQLLAVLRR
ncbi:MAG: NYN domain-containing protein [Acidimicrobiales bacterium]